MATGAQTKSNRHLRLVLDEHERERSDLAHRLHDQLAQSLAAVVLGLKGLERDAPAAEAARLAALREQLADALDLCTELAVRLRPAVLDELGLAPALESLAQRAGVNRVTVDPPLAAARLEPELETEVYRTVEEALAAMPAGCTVAVRLDAGSGALLLSIHADDHASEIGDLARIKPRMELSGGTLRMHPHGFRLRIPIPGADAAAASVFPQPRRVENPDGARLPLP
jgi:signal transduction histidine kinase